MNQKNKIIIQEITDINEIKQVACLANEIWKEYYTELLETGQIEYMLDRFQSTEVIRYQITEEKYRYFIADDHSKYIGYCALKEDNNKNDLFLSKFYVRKDCRGQGVGKQMLAFAINQFSSNSETTVWLTVNKQNEASIAAYKKCGFYIVGELVADIGNGFVMDDYRLECPAVLLRKISR